MISRILFGDGKALDEGKMFDFAGAARFNFILLFIAAPLLSRALNAIF